MPFGVLIVGDEILSGRRQDKHLTHAIELLAQRGLSLAWAHYLGDDADALTAALTRSFVGNDIVFSFGGIGATPDDKTRQSAAAALDVSLVEHPEAIAAMRAKPGFELTPNRRQMAVFPTGATIIPNPYNGIAAFSVRDHHFLPGFPEMAWPMMEWVLDTRYRHLFHAHPQATQTIVIERAGESELIDMMNAIVADYPQLKLSSLPQHVPGGRIIEFSLSGDPAAVPVAMAVAQAEITRLGFAFTHKN